MMARFRSCALSASVILISACGGPQTPVGVVPAPNALSGSWMLPEAKGQDLIYFSTESGSGGRATYILSLPQGKLVGRFSAVGGLCSDNIGNVWVTRYPNGRRKELAEYAHGGVKPVKILHVPNMLPGSCAVDPTSGNLALTGDGQEVDVYSSGSSYPQIYAYEKFYPHALTYDGSGNLFILGNGHVRDDSLAVAELPKGAAKFQPRRSHIHLSATSGFGWDGKYLTIGDSLFEGTSFSATQFAAIAYGAAGIHLSAEIFNTLLTIGLKARKLLLLLIVARITAAHRSICLTIPREANP
jgi:hypothetical protein